MKIIQNFENSGDKAAKYTFDLVKAHAINKISNVICEKYGNGNCDTKLKPPSVIVFDIDDTLKHENEPHTEIINLFLRLQNDKKINSRIYIVTARVNDKDYIRETRNELKNVYGIDNYQELIHAPNKYRKNLGDVAVWKESKRKCTSEDSNAPYVVLTVGDQWGDLLPLKTEKEIDTLDKLYGSQNYMLIRPEDGVSLWGLKLPSS